MDPWLVLAGLAAVALLFVVIPVVGDAYLRFRGRRAIRCPEAGAEAAVDLDARHAAFTAAFRRPRLRVAGCSLWPGRRGCGQRCVDLPDMQREPTAHPTVAPDEGVVR